MNFFKIRIIHPKPSPQIQCDFALQPIPKEYYFEDLDNFIQPFDKKLIPYPDINFVNAKLIPHFKESLEILKKSICDLNKEIEEKKEIAQKSLFESQKFYSDEYKMNFLNREIIRNLKILIPKKEEIKRTILFNKISYLEKRLELLNNIEKVTNYLITSPRYCFINLQFLQETKDSYIQDPDIYLKYDSISRKVYFLELQLSSIQDPFTEYEKNNYFTMKILSFAITLKIPDSKCIKYSEELDLFRFFLESENSPTHFTFVSQSAKDVDLQIKMMINSLSIFCQMVSKDSSLYDILYFILIEFFFEIFFEKFETNPLKIERNSKIIDNNLYELKLYTMKDLGISSQNLDFLDLNADELFDRNSQLKPLIFELLTCIFLINPIEIFFTIRKIGNCLKSVFTNENDLFVAWKALFVASSVPSVDVIFQKLSYWKDLSLISNLYNDVCKIPNQVLAELNK